MPQKITRLTGGDPYDVRVAFDDLYTGPLHAGYEIVGEESDWDDVSTEEVGWSMRAILDQVRRGRLRPPPVIMTGVEFDPTFSTFQEAGKKYTLIGDDDRTGLPIFDQMREKFSEALPTPKIVRVDDRDSYEQFQGARRQKYLQEIDDRLTALERAFDEHVSDQHGGGRLARLERAFMQHLEDPTAHTQAVVGAVEEARSATQTIDLPLAEARTGKIKCWQDGDEICCTIRFTDKRGKARAATTGEPLERSIEEVVGCGIRAGVRPEALRQVVGDCARLAGAARLVGELVSMAPDLVGFEPGSVFRTEPNADPTTAAAMALLQRCQTGDRRALAEAERLSWSNPNFVRRCLDRLVRAQKNKRKRR